MRTGPLAWSPDIAYAVGLSATDGCLSGDGRHLFFDSSDRELVVTYLRCIGRTNRILELPTDSGGIRYRASFGDVELYRWLQQAGLTPRKSLTLGPVHVPDELFMHMVRGLLDGDGSIVNKSYRADVRDRSDYWWEYLTTSFNSASRTHIAWLRDELAQRLGIRGFVLVRPPSEGRHEFLSLRYGKRESIRLLTSLYVGGEPCLERKRAIWHDYLERHPAVASTVR